MMPEAETTRKPLAGLAVLITRPEGQSDELLAMIEEAGGIACHFPVMQITALDVEEDSERLQRSRQTVLNLDQYRHIIVISANAAKFGLELIDQYWPQLPLDLHWYAIGQATATALQKSQIAVEGSTAPIDTKTMNSEALIKHANLQQLHHEKVLIIRGVGGRNYLKEQLLLRGAKVDYLECYQRRKVDRRDGELIQFIRNNAINTLCVNSAESIDYFSDLLGNGDLTKIQSLPLIVPSARVAAHAEKKGYSFAVTAENAGNAAVAAALCNIANKRHEIANKRHEI
jgi:uroporphyrinogen-III synthase